MNLAVAVSDVGQAPKVENRPRVTPLVLPHVTTHQSIHKHHDFVYCMRRNEKTYLLQPKMTHAKDSEGDFITCDIT
jgi:hypothetical protein